MRKPKGTKERTRRGIPIEHVGDVDDLPPKLDARARAASKIADDEDAACRVNFRWESTQLNLVKAVAAGIGVPYQTYMKMVLYKQALDDWQTIHKSGQRADQEFGHGVAEPGTSKKQKRSKRLEY